MNYPRESTGYIEETILRTLSETGPLMASGFAELTGYDIQTAWQRLNRLHSKGLLHVAVWVRNYRGNPWKAYGIGRHADAPKPAKQSATEVNKRRWATVKADKKTHQRIKAYRRKLHRQLTKDEAYVFKLRAKSRQYARKKFGYTPRPVKLPDVARIDPILAALMGSGGEL